MPCPPFPAGASPRRKPGRRACSLASAAAALLIALAGCATPPPPPALVPLLQDAAYAPPAHPLPAAEALFKPSPAMLAFLANETMRATLQREPRRGLLEALYRPRAGNDPGLKLDYDAAMTRTAAEAFEQRSGNCLSLVIMTASLARELGLMVSFQVVEVEQSLARIGSLTLASGHVNVVLGPSLVRGRFDHRAGGEHLVVDFLPDRDLRNLPTRPISQATVVAMYFNNRAAELLADGQVDAAYWHAREALHHDPGFLAAANTLGLVHHRAGHAAAAEHAFREVLARDADAVAALGNLVALLRAQGREVDAAPLAERLAALQPVPPFHWLRAGRQALAAGDARGALALLRRELRRQPEQDEVHFALAEAHWRLGDRVRAAEHLTWAAEFSPRQADQRRYAAKLGRLRAAAGAAAMP